MVEVRVRQPIAPDDVAAVRALADAAAAVDGHPSLGDAVWRDLADPSPQSTLILADHRGSLAGAVHLAAPENDANELVAAAVVHPDHRGVGVGTALVTAAVHRVAVSKPGRVVLWAFGADDRADEFALACGFERMRELWQMRVALPLSEAPQWPDTVHVRPFEPGRDEDDWLAVNNRAFAADPDQGGWSLETLREREAAPWFDPRRFLLAVDDRGIAGFCWTKVHPPSPPIDPDPVGEIYVIGVDPDRQGSGLGRALVVGGLASLADLGLRTGMLFVDAANEPAVELYRALGFDVARVDRAYARAVS